MPNLIEAADANGATITYYIMGTVNRNNALDWYEENEVIDASFKASAEDNSDGYSLWFVNSEIMLDVYAAEADLNMICLMSKQDCECAICAGLKGTFSTSTVSAYGLYF